MKQMESNGRPIIFGEALFDVLPDGKKIPEADEEEWDFEEEVEDD